MKVLLDTHVLIWSVAQPRRLADRTRALIVDPSNEKLFSAASIWEVAIKAALGRADFNLDALALLEAARLDFGELPVRSSAAARVVELPLHHRDPFDRILIAQAMDESAVLLTADRALMAYGAHVTFAD